MSDLVIESSASNHLVLQVSLSLQVPAPPAAAIASPALLAAHLRLRRVAVRMDRLLTAHSLEAS